MSYPASAISEASSFVKPPFKIAIIGAGIGGLAFAIGCLKNNIEYVLYESASEYSAVGAGIGLGPNALRALDMLDPRLRAMYNDISSGNLTPNKEHVMFDLLYAEKDFGQQRGWEPAPFGSQSYDRTSAHRKDLLNILTSVIPPETVHFNKKVTNIQQADDGIKISFTDGETVEASAVIGCDGVKGLTRSCVLNKEYPEEVQPKFSGKYVYRAVIPMKDALDIFGANAGDARAFVGHSLIFITFPISTGTQCNLVAFKFTDKPWEHPQWTKPVSREEMIADFADEVDSRLVKLLDWAEPVQWALHHHMDTPAYYNGRICLLGDSAHATTPHQAAGAGQCIEDALVLSHLLGQLKDPQQLSMVFQVYDSIRRPRAQKVVQTSQEAGQLYSFRHPDAGQDMTKIVDNFNQRFSWIWEHDLAQDLKTGEQMLAKLTDDA